MNISGRASLSLYNLLDTVKRFFSEALSNPSDMTRIKVNGIVCQKLMKRLLVSTDPPIAMRKLSATLFKLLQYSTKKEYCEMLKGDEGKFIMIIMIKM